MKPRILYVEDDETLSFLTKDNLSSKGYQIIHKSNGQEALDFFESNDIDLCLLDVMLPIMDGFELAEKIRHKNAAIPIIFLTAKSLKEDKIQGLTLGGDDYITKPFSIEELVLKIEVFLKRKNITSSATIQSIEIGQFAFEPKNLVLKKGDEVKKLTFRESQLLFKLISHKNNIVKRENILEEIWGENDYFLGRSLDVFISRLRKYLSSDPKISIENIHGVGFRLNI